MSVIWDGFVSEIIFLEKLFDPESKIQRDDDRSVEQVSETVKTLTEWQNIFMIIVLMIIVMTRMMMMMMMMIRWWFCCTRAAVGE